ncbi:MAG: type II toxin-antitoxin system RelE/ParE family toxin [Ginsengibacter sp.]
MAEEEIIKEVLWSDSARISFDEIVFYLQTTWSEKETKRFINRVSRMIATLKIHPEMGRPSKKRKNVRIGILDKRAQIIYHYKAGNNKLKFYFFGV